MEIYFVRHGQTVWNLEKRFQGLGDSPLTEKGIEQAKLLGKKLEKVKFDKFFSSPLKRAMDTAKYIRGNREIEIETLDKFVEISMGQMEGIKQDDFKEKYPEQMDNFFNNPIKYDPSAYGGENFFEVKKRVDEGLKELIKKYSNLDRILIVSHGATLKVLFNYISKNDFSTLKDEEIPKNTSYTIIKYNGNNFKIIDFSNISHLKENL